MPDIIPEGFESQRHLAAKTGDGLDMVISTGYVLFNMKGFSGAWNRQDLVFLVGPQAVTMANRPEAAGRWPQHLPDGAIRVGRSRAHYDQTVRFYRDLVGLPLLQSFAASYGEDGTIFGLSDTAVQLEIVRSVAPAVRADRVDMLVLTPARGVPEQYCASAQ